MKAYLDADVILDVLLKRNKFLQESSRVLNLCEQKKIIGCTTTLAIANIYYILRKIDNTKVRIAIKYLREILKVLPVTDVEIGKSLESKFKDFEDGVQNFTAESNKCKKIITRNIKDYKESQLSVMSPKEFLLDIS